MKFRQLRMLSLLLACTLSVTPAMSVLAEGEEEETPVVCEEAVVVEETAVEDVVVEVTPDAEIMQAEEGEGAEEAAPSETKEEETKEPEASEEVQEGSEEQPEKPEEAAPEEEKVAVDGDYEAEVESSSTMFKVVKCVLTAKNGTYKAKVTLSGTGYDYLYTGTAEQAETDEKNWVPFVEEDGMYTYVIDVPALDKPVDVAAHSIKNDKWYDRQLTFSSANVQYKPAGDSAVSDGDYKVEVESNSKMFKVVDSTLRAKGGAYEADITLSGTGYDLLFVGTSEEAAAAGEEKWIGYKENAEGLYVFTIPVKKLDEPIAVAAHSVKSDSWYDRELTFKSSSLESLNKPSDPETKPEEKPQPDPKPEAGPENIKPDKESEHAKDPSKGTSKVDSTTGLKDGVYKPDKFSWSGGTGKVQITCSQVTVKNGQALATITFSSPHYGYVKANGNKYFPTVSGKSSTFTIPVKLNANNTIVGMTTAMSTAHEIFYNIYVYIAGAEGAGNAQVKLDADKLSEKAPEIVGLELAKEVETGDAKLFKMFQYDQGITMVEVDLAADTDRPEEEMVTQEAQASEEEEEAGETKQKGDDLYHSKVLRYLIVPEGAEIPAGLEKEMIVIQKPVTSVYSDLEGMEDILEKFGAEKLLAVQADEAAAEPDYKALVTKECNLAILSDAILWDKEASLSIEEQSERFYDITDRFITLGIPALIDRSADEESKEAQAEWMKVYEAIFDVK